MTDAFTASTDGAGRPCIKHRGVYLPTETARATLASFEESARDKSDWFHRDAAQYADQIRTALEQIS